MGSHRREQREASVLLLGNRYQLEEALGQGGAGVVYRAFDLKWQRPVAVKRLEASAGGPDQGVERLRREAALLSRLAHPNIVSFYELGEEDGQPYLVLEYIAGSTLRNLLDSWGKPLPLETASHIIRGVLSALAAAHQARVIHRDLKPENIMLVGVEPETAGDLEELRPAVKVMDFGLAYLHGQVRITKENLVAGTALYLAPEAALGQAVDGRADLYGAGIILYEMLAGHPPYSGEDPLVVVSQHLHATPISPRWHNPAIPPDLATLILKLLAKNPDERYQRAEEVLSDLETVRRTGGHGGSPTKESLLEAMARGRLIGRRQEMALLRERIEAMLRGLGSVVFIEGEAGVGKSRLVREAGVYARLRGAQIFTGHCHSADLALPYQPFIEIVKSYVRVNSERGAVAHVPGRLAAELVKLAPGLEALLNQTPATPPDSSPAEARLRLFEAVTALLTGGRAPVLVVLENLHWANPPELALLLHLAQTSARNRRLLFLATYQGHQTSATLSEVLVQLDRAGLAHRLRLEPLAAEEITELLETLLEGEISSEFSRAIFQVTEGNPFFVEEVLKALIEEGGVFRDPAHGQWEDMALQHLEIPASLKEVIGRRLEKLSQINRRVLSIAGLLGRQFRADVLLTVAGVGEETMQEALEAALRMQLIRRSRSRSRSQAGAPDQRVDAEAYTFEHGLICQTLVDSLTSQRRKRLHRQIGHALERLNQSRARPIAPPDELAYHFSAARGDDVEKAISYNLLAVENALQIYASEVAARHYQLILDLLEGSDDIIRQVEVLERLGDLYFERTRQMVDAVAVYERAIGLWQRSPAPDIPRLIRLYRKVGEVARYWPGRVSRLDAYLSEALRLLDENPGQVDELERARVLIALAFNLHAQEMEGPEAERALKLAQEAAELAARLNAPDEESAALEALQRIQRSQGQLAATHDLDRRRLAIIPRLTNPTERIDAYLGASQSGWETGNLAAALDYCRKGLAIARQTDNVGAQWEALRRLVMLYLQWGKLAEAITYAEQGAALGPRAGILEFGEPVEALFHTHLAILYTLQGEAESASRELARLGRMYPTPDAPPYRFALGWLHYENEAWAKAKSNLEGGQAFPLPFLSLHFDRVLRLEVYGHLGDRGALDEARPAAEAEARRWNLPYLVATLQRGYGAYYCQQGDWQQAEAAFERALAATRGTTFWYQDARTWLDYGRMVARRGQPGDTDLARDYLSEAQSMFAAFGAHALAERAWVEVTRLES